MWRAQAGNREAIPGYALEWRDGFGEAARPAVLAAASEADAALALEILGLYGTAPEPTASWRRMVEEVGPERMAPVARVVIETVSRLDDNPNIVDPATNPMFLAPESEILARAAAWVVAFVPGEGDLALLRDVAIKCAARHSIPGPRVQRAPGVAMSIIAALGSLSDTPASESARQALGAIGETITYVSVRNAVDRQLQAFST